MSRVAVFVAPGDYVLPLDLTAELDELRSKAAQARSAASAGVASGSAIGRLSPKRSGLARELPVPERPLHTRAVASRIRFVPVAQELPVLERPVHTGGVASGIGFLSVAEKLHVQMGALHTGRVDERPKESTVFAEYTETISAHAETISTEGTLHHRRWPNELRR